MPNEVIYKVLWIDDDPAIIEAYQIKAEDTT